MTIELLITAGLAGWVSPLLVSLASRNHWSRRTKFLLAIGLAAGAAIGILYGRGEALTWRAFEAAFGAVFATQQATWHLGLPGGGSGGLNAALAAALGGGAAAPDLEDGEQIVVEGGADIT